jgi:hypothetical protein
VKLFLSYATEDEEVSLMIATELRGLDFEVYRWQDEPGGRVIEGIEQNINDSDVFLALLSPAFLRSPWCRLERDLAVHREQDLQAAASDRIFIYVLEARHTEYPDAGVLRRYSWIGLNDRRNLGEVLEGLVSRLMSSTGRVPVSSPATDRGISLFRNRRDELERVLRALTTVSGIHFWLIIAPPQLGKTWFLDRLSAEMVKMHSAHWTSTLVDLREQPAPVCGDTRKLLSRLFALEALPASESDSLRHIARGIIRSRKSHLCLLDSAELLSKATAKHLRSCLSRIHHLVRLDAGNLDIGLAFVVASRREDEWRGVTPDPRISALPLTQFDSDVVEDAVRDLARQMNRSYSSSEFRHYAQLVHSLSEGQPALLVRCLQWIRTEEWVDMERLASQDTFAELAGPYIRAELLSHESLLPPWADESFRQQDPQQAERSRLALEHAFRLLAPYRLFTQSHLSHHLETDSDFASALDTLRWSIVDLWKSISGTALLYRPLDEPWQVIYAAIRRLIYRHFHTSDEARAQAHREARSFVEVWANKQFGTEQAIGLVECLWHEAMALRLEQSADMGEILIASAQARSLAIKSSSAFSVEEMREYAVRKMRNDIEFQRSVGNIDGLFDRIATIVTAPE